jgi:hypothetical protein
MMPDGHTHRWHAHTSKYLAPETARGSVEPCPFTGGVLILRRCRGLAV